MTIELPRRGFILGLAALVAAPAIVRAGSLMPVRNFKTLTLAEYQALLLVSMIDDLQQQIYDSIVFGSNYDGLAGLLTPIPHSDIFK